MSQYKVEEVIVQSTTELADILNRHYGDGYKLVCFVHIEGVAGLAVVLEQRPQ